MCRGQVWQRTPGRSGGRAWATGMSRGGTGVGDPFGGSRGYSPITLQSSPIMMKKPLNRAMRATEP
jgi:hypothetical protein